MTKTFSTLADLTQDPRNARKHGERNIGQIEKSLEQYGAARSIVVDEDGRVLAGNGLVEAAASVGILRVRTVEANGNEIIAVVRRGLTEQQKLGLSIADNRTSELADWDPAVLADLSADIDLTAFWSADELTALLAPDDAAEEQEQANEKKAVECPSCGHKFQPS